MKKFVSIITSLLLVISFTLSGCSNVATSVNVGYDASTGAAASVEASIDTGNGSAQFSVPAYSSSPYVNVNDNVPFFTESDLTTEAFETYSNLDSLGRCGVAYANVCQEIMPSEERGNIGSVKPTGWHTVKYDNISGKYLYNRCHLIAFELAGENANVKNLITGTRYMNVSGMLPFENAVAEYVISTGNHVLYRVTPIFEGDNLLASGVLMEAYSVEDAGEGISFCIYCYNVQPGIDINYATGDSSSSVAGTIAAAAVTTATSGGISAGGSSSGGSGSSNSGDTQYLLNTNTKKFHTMTCSAGQKTGESNRQYYTGSREDVIDMGYEPCKKCNP